MELKSQAKNTDMELKKYVFDEMDKRGWTPAELSRRSGISQTKITNIKKGKSVNAKNLCLILRAFGVFDPKKEISEVCGYGLPKNILDFIPNIEKYIEMLSIAIENEDYNLLLSITNSIFNGIQKKINRIQKDLKKMG